MTDAEATAIIELIDLLVATYCGYIAVSIGWKMTIFMLDIF